MDEKLNAPQQLNIEVPDDIAGGIYSNFVIVGHSGAEFVLDFVQVLPGLPKAIVRSRIIMSPQHAKRLMGAMEENLHRYETSFGPIELHDTNPSSFPPPFGGPAGIA
jgi:Protein of unknown function (DUF3467)